ncbi:unnamed protein product, partial [Mesorhabditis belari]|uniref:MATH domain-containing protein n=1 Tax=Mesorhabditis belari TaxID=2138241 RepID=A0AAF3F7Q2_9BILA
MIKMAELATDAHPLQEVVTVRPILPKTARQPSPRPSSRDSMLTPIGSPKDVERKLTPMTISPLVSLNGLNEEKPLGDTPPLPASMNPPGADDIINCPFKDFGCTCRGRTLDIKKHIRDDKFDHLAQLCDKTISFRAKAMESMTNSTGNIDLAARLSIKSQAIVMKFSSQLVWRIDNYRKHFETAKKGRIPVIYSPPFHSHRHGYKMCAVLAPFGEGKAVREYASIFVSILKDEYDGILPWPFQCPITITWINQDETHQNKIETLIPKAVPENEPFLGRPPTERNPAFGIQRFIRVAELTKGKFIVNDTAFIRVDVDVRDVPTL